MLGRLTASWREAGRAQRLYWLAMALSLLLGIFLRLNGYLGQRVSLWLDEALWAPRFVDWPLLKLGIRPIGFVWLTRVLINTFGATEIWLRFLPNLGALVSLALMPYVASRLLQTPALRVLLVLLFAIHPALVDFANEFKPYSFEVLVHLVPIVLYLRYEQTQRLGYLYALLAYLPLGFLLAYNLAFAFPGALLLCLLVAWRHPAKRRLLAVTVLGGALCAVTVGATYKLALSTVTKQEKTENYWGKKYDVFYRDAADDGESRLGWTLSKHADLAAMIGLRRQLWSDPGPLPERAAREIGTVDRWLWLVLSGAGLWALWRNERRLLLLLAAPMLTLTLANLVGKWPLGAFRTNLFTAVYLFPLPLVGLELCRNQNRDLGRALLGGVLACCVLPGFLFGFDWHGHKRTWTRDHYQREVIEKLYELRQRQLRENPNLGRARLILDLHTHESYDYYLGTHPEFRAKYREFFAKNFVRDNVGSNKVVSKAQQRLRAKEPVWVVVSKDSSTQAIDDFAKTKANVLLRERIRDEHVILLLDTD